MVIQRAAAAFDDGDVQRGREGEGLPVQPSDTESEGGEELSFL